LTEVSAKTLLLNMTDEYVRRSLTYSVRRVGSHHMWHVRYFSVNPQTNVCD